MLDVNVACGPKTKRNAFPRRTLSKVLSLQKLQRQSCKGGIQNTACYASHAFLHRRGCVGCECGLRAENKKKCFSETYPEQSALSAKVAKTKLQRRNSKYSLLRFPRLPSQTSYFLRQVPCARNELTVNVH